VSEDAKAAILLGLTMSLNDDRDQERNKLPQLSGNAELQLGPSMPSRPIFTQVRLKVKSFLALSPYKTEKPPCN